MFFCSSIAFVMVRVLKVVKSANMPQRDYMRRVMPIGLLYAASLWLSNSAYLHLSVSFIQMTKALMPGLARASRARPRRRRLRVGRAQEACPASPGASRAQVYTTGVFMGTETLTRTNAAIMVLIAIGVAVAAYGEINFVVIGVVEQLSALVFEATRLMLVQVRAPRTWRSAAGAARPELRQRHRLPRCKQVLMSSQGYVLNPIQSLYYVSPACLICLTARDAAAVLATSRALCADACVPLPRRCRSCSWRRR